MHGLQRTIRISRIVSPQVGTEKEVSPSNWGTSFFVALISGGILHFRLLEKRRKRLNVIHAREDPIFHYRLEITI